MGCLLRGKFSYLGTMVGESYLILKGLTCIWLVKNIIGKFT